MLNTQDILGRAHSKFTEYAKNFLDAIPMADTKIFLGFKTTAVKEMMYYAIFIAVGHGAHVVFKPIIGDPAAYLATFITGAIMQGNPFCIYQQRLETGYPILSMLTGGINGFLGCKAFSALSSILSPILGFIADTLFSAVLMCKAEQIINYCADIFSNHVMANDRSTEVPQPVCCHL
jgi:hypothetical protein